MGSCGSIASRVILMGPQCEIPLNISVFLNSYLSIVIIQFAVIFLEIYMFKIKKNTLFLIKMEMVLCHVYEFIHF